jgi:hypothetical protein
MRRTNAPCSKTGMVAPGANGSLPLTVTTATVRFSTRPRARHAAAMPPRPATPSSR